MARPKSDDPRSKRLVVRCTPEEEARVKAAAGAAGLSQTDYVRRRLLEGRPAAALLERTEPGTAATTALTAVAPPPRSALHRCPKFAFGCGFEAPSARARCPIHGCTVKP